MNVKTLIAQLRCLDQDLEVRTVDPHWGDYDPISNVSVETQAYSDIKVVVIR